MNQRIKDLFEQACFETEYDDIQNLKEMSQRFAELIIKETLQIARVGMEFGPSMDEAVYTYFGIEE
jgi:hypothetical protein